jgi:hypothetical protein
MLFIPGCETFYEGDECSDPIVQQAAAKLVGFGESAFSNDSGSVIPIARPLPQRLYLCAELVDGLLEILDCGQFILNWRRQLAGYPIGGYPDRLVDIFESKLHQWPAPTFAQQNPDARPCCVGLVDAESAGNGVVLLIIWHIVVRIIWRTIVPDGPSPTPKRRLGAGICRAYTFSPEICSLMPNSEHRSVPHT